MPQSVREFRAKFFEMFTRNGWLACFYSLFAVVATAAVVAAAAGKLKDGGEVTMWGVVAIAFFALFPPIWFFVEYHMETDEKVREQIASSQACSARVWAAVLAVLLFCCGELPFPSESKNGEDANASEAETPGTEGATKGSSNR